MSKINKIEIEKDYILNIEFNDEKIKRVDLSPYLSKGIFTKLKDKNYFQLVKNNLYFISWPNKQELSLDTLYYS